MLSAQCPPSQGQRVCNNSCVAAREGYIVGLRMTADLSRFRFTIRYWRTVAGSAD